MEKKKLLPTGLAELGLKPTQKQIEAFAAYLSELKKWSRAYSLTSLRDDNDIIIKHFLDSCLYLEGLPPGPFSLADVGSGAGLPGIPIRILRPEVTVHLIESVGKKAAFLRNIVQKLGLDGASVVQKRVEDIQDMQVDVAVTRALFTVEEFHDRCMHIVRKDGLFVMNKGPRAVEELRDLKEDFEVREAVLPLTDIKREIIIMRNG